jgi:copper chaperone
MFELTVERMSCGGCARSVTKSVQSVDGTAKVEVDLASKKVRIDSQASLDAVRSAIIEAGYPVTASSSA